MSHMSESIPALDRLEAGVLRFQRETYPQRKEAYEYAATHPQRPHTLFITCSDSRINVEDLVSAEPGEVFITRNIGNIVPSYRKPLDAVSAVIEYAVLALKVQHVVVCGHSDCGAMKAVLKPESAASLPAVRTWLENAPGAVQEAEAADSLRSTTEKNVLAQLESLKTHPAVADGLSAGTLTLSGWVYDIGAGQVRVARDGGKHFQVVTATEGTGQR